MEPSLQAEIRAMPKNSTCVDCSARNPQWASVSYGTLMCLECSGKHRSLGVHISFVRSIQMDSWTSKQIKMMRIGGNEKFQKFLKSKGVDNSVDVRQKYYTDACALYRLRLQALRDGKEPPEQLSEQEKHQGVAGGNVVVDETSVERERRLRKEAEERLAAKFGPGGLKGQNSTSCRSKNAESSIERSEVTEAIGSAFNWLSAAAKKSATIAAEKTAAVVHTVNDPNLHENVRGTLSSGWEKTLSTLNDPALNQTVKTTASSGWNSLVSGTSSLWNKVSETAASVLAAESSPNDHPELKDESLQPKQHSVVTNRNHKNDFSGNLNDEAWLQQQLEHSKRNLSLQPTDGVMKDSWNDDVDVDVSHSRNMPASSHQASETAENEVNVATREQVPSTNDNDDDDFFGNWGA